MKRKMAIIGALVIASACAQSPTGPASVGTAIDVAGAWTGTFSSSNNPAVAIDVNLTQNGSSLSGTWKSSEFLWSGEVSASLNASAVTGTLSFSGQAIDGTTCAGSANFTGTVSASSMTLNSANGVLGSSCPAPLPVGVQIDLHR